MRLFRRIIKALLAGQGIYGFQSRRADAITRLAELRSGDGHVLVPRLYAEIGRELERLAPMAVTAKVCRRTCGLTGRLM